MSLHICALILYKYMPGIYPFFTHTFIGI